MSYFLLNIFLALTWAALTGSFNPGNLLVGFILGYFVLGVSRRALGPSTYFGKVLEVVGFVVFYITELFLSNLRMALRVVIPRYHLAPRIVAVPLETTNELAITLLANLVTFTPGSLSLDVSTDRRVLYVHVIYAPDADIVRKQIKQGFERRVLQLLRRTSDLENGKEVG